MKKKIEKITNSYEELAKQRLSNGKLMLKDTVIGYWGITPISELVELFKKTKLNKHKKFIDLGSGDGRAVIVADLFTNATGIEFDDELYDHAKEIKKSIRSKAKLIKGDFLEHNLKQYDYIFIHPDQHISKLLEPKINQEMKKEAKLIVFGPHYHPEGLNADEKHDIKGSLVTIYTRQK